MKIEDIIALTNAGWSKEEIIRMSELEQKEPEQKEPEQKEQKEPEQKEQKEPEQKEQELKEPEKKEPDTSKDDKMAEILQRLEQISSGIQKGAIRDSQQPQRESVEDALAKIINPYIDKEEKNNG